MLPEFGWLGRNGTLSPILKFSNGGIDAKAANSVSSCFFGPLASGHCQNAGGEPLLAEEAAGAGDQ